jgi:cytoskeletal protein RodZ
VASDDEPDWHDQRQVVVTAGVAALILVALLVYAVIRTSDSSKVPDTLPIPSSSATPSTYTTTSTSTTSYSVPRVQTSEDKPVTPGSPTSGPTSARNPTR